MAETTPQRCGAQVLYQSGRTYICQRPSGHDHYHADEGLAWTLDWAHPTSSHAGPSTAPDRKAPGHSHG